MSLIKEALDKAVEENRDEQSIKESYENLNGSKTENQAKNTEDNHSEESDPVNTISFKKILIIVFLIVLFLIAIAQVIFLILFFSS